jgi:hypothetical protein
MAKKNKGDALARIVAAARKDPEFFHNLVFDPKKAIAKAPFLDRATKTRLTKGLPASVIAGILGKFSDCGNSKTCSGSTCSGTCGSDSCQGVTCGGGSCSGTCTNSCTDTISPPAVDLLKVQLDKISFKFDAKVRTALRSRVRG